MKKIVSSVVLVLLVIYMLVTSAIVAPSYNRGGVYIMRKEISEKIDCAEYQSETYKTVQKFEIEKAGRYMIEAQWKNDSDMVVGWVLVSPEGVAEGYCTGNEVNMKTLPINLDKGTYEMIFLYMAKEADVEEFCDMVETEWNFDYPTVDGVCTIMGDYGVKLVGPDIFVEGFYVVSMIVALMGSVLALFTLINAFKK